MHLHGPPDLSVPYAQTLKGRIMQLLQSSAAAEGSPEAAELELEVRHFQLVSLVAIKSASAVSSASVLLMPSCPSAVHISEFTAHA